VSNDKKNTSHQQKYLQQAGLDNVTPAICKYHQLFGLDAQFLTLVHNFNNIFLIDHLFRAGQPMEVPAFANTRAVKCHASMTILSQTKWNTALPE
jgi:hypothetical protein